MHLYIALSTLARPHTLYHWALVTSDAVPTGVVNVYQITDSEGTWHLEHDRLWLRDIKGFIGCVCLSRSVTEDPKQIDAFIREFPAEQGRYRTDGASQWSCARWIMRCLESLVEAEIVQLDMNKLDETVVARGMQLESGKGDDITVKNEIPIIDL